MTEAAPARGVRSLDLQVHVIRAHEVLILDNPSSVYLVRSGSAQVSKTEVESGSPVGRRRFLFRARAHDALFTMLDVRNQGSRLMVVPVGELTILHIPLERIKEVFQSEGVSDRTAIEEWVNNAAAFISQEEKPVAAETLLSGQMLLDTAQHVHPGRNGFAWVRVEQGRALLMGIPELELQRGDGYLPVSSGMWITAAEPSKLHILTTEEILHDRDLPSSLSLLHTLLVKRLATLDAEDYHTEILRLEQRGLMQQRLVESALESVKSVLDPQTTLPARETALLSAVAAVGDALGIEIHPPLRSENPRRTRDAIESIVRASRVRDRRVLLRGAWWRHDCGPLIGYLSERQTPVALLRSGSGYEIVDPDTREKIRVNDRTAQLLAPEAVVICPSLPEDVKKPWQLFRFSLRGRFTDILFVIGLSGLATLIGMLVPLAMGLVMDQAIPDSNRTLLLQLGLALVASSLGTALFGLSRGLIVIRTAVSTDAATESLLWDKVLKLRAQFFKDYSAGDLLSRVMAVSEINRVLNGAALQSMLSSVMALLNLGLLFYYSPKLATIAIGLAVATAIVTIIGGYFVRQYTLALTALTGTLFGLVVQMVTAVGKIRVAGAEQRAHSLWLQSYSEQLRLVRKSQSVEDYVTVFNQVIPTISTILLFWVGVDLLTGGTDRSGAQTIGVGSFLAFNLALGTFISGTSSLSNTVVDVMNTLTKSARIKPILEAEPEVSKLKTDPGSFAGSVTLSHVDFRYTASGPKILDDLSMHVSPGEFAALAGPSGGGKSTIFRLLLGFETADSGTILFDGQDLAGLDITAVRRQLGVVLQSGFVAAGSIFENIAGSALVTIDQAWEAAADAGLADDIKSMPMGMHTIVSEGGTNLSGGQRQRLLIARALVTRPRILLFDEATSALDNRTQAVVTESLRRRRVTRIVIAHRVSTIKDADQIYVLDQGRIVDRGTFDELAGRKGLFAAMIARQMV